MRLVQDVNGVNNALENVQSCEKEHHCAMIEWSFRQRDGNLDGLKSPVNQLVTCKHSEAGYQRRLTIIPNLVGRETRRRRFQTLIRSDGGTADHVQRDAVKVTWKASISMFCKARLLICYSDDVLHICDGVLSSHHVNASTNPTHRLRFASAQVLEK